MSSFYGNIKFNNQTPLIFDKIYPSRKAMEAECKTDGIFNGRYVLVSYGEIQYVPYLKIDHISQDTFDNNVASGIHYYMIDSRQPDGFVEVTSYNSNIQLYIKTNYYSKDLDSTFAKNKSQDEEAYHHDYHNTVWQKIWTSTQSDKFIEEKYIMVSHLNAETPTVRMIVDAPNDMMEFDENNKGYFLVGTDQLGLNEAGKISYQDFNDFHNKLYIEDGVDEQNPNIKKYRLLKEDDKWNIDTIYYLRKSSSVYEKFPDGRPYKDGMVSFGLYDDLIHNRLKKLFVEIQEAIEDQTNLINHLHVEKEGLKELAKQPVYQLENELEIKQKRIQEIEELIASKIDQNEIAKLEEEKQKLQAEIVVLERDIEKKQQEIQGHLNGIENEYHASETGKISKVEIYLEWLKSRLDLFIETKFTSQYSETEINLMSEDQIESIKDTIKSTIKEFLPAPEDSWDRLSRYYLMQYKTADGRPHFDPIMSTDLEYRFHMPRNWKWDNDLDFEYNLEGFNPAKANFTNTQQNKINLTTKSSGDTYPVHRNDEPSAALYELKTIEQQEEDIRIAKAKYEEKLAEYLVKELEYKNETDQDNKINLKIELEYKEYEKNKAYGLWQSAIDSLNLCLKTRDKNFIIKTEQPDTKRFNFDFKMIGDAVSNMWDTVYPRIQKENPESIRDTYIGSDRLRYDHDEDPNTPDINPDKENYPETVAEAVRKLYYWLGLKSDNNFKYGPWVDPKTKEEIDTVFGVLNGASDVLGDLGDNFNPDLFIPVASPYYPDGYGKNIGDILNTTTGETYSGLTYEEFKKLNDGGAGPLYIKVGEKQYVQAKDYKSSEDDPDWEGYDYTLQYYRNMNSLLAMLRVWQNTVKENQADWIFEDGHREWNDDSPFSPRYIHNKPISLSIDSELYDPIDSITKEEFENRINNKEKIYYFNTELEIYLPAMDYDSSISQYYEDHKPAEATINWYWKNYAL